MVGKETVTVEVHKDNSLGKLVYVHPKTQQGVHFNLWIDAPNLTTAELEEVIAKHMNNLFQEINDV